MSPEEIDFCSNTWAPALLDGSYTQGTGRLRTQNDHYCCLGVYCDLSGNGEWTHDPVNQDWVYVAGSVCQEFVVPFPIIAKAGLLDPYLHFSNETLPLPPNFELGERNWGRHYKHQETYGDYVAVAGMNDAGWSFEAIAGVILDICNLWEEYNNANG